MLYKSNYPVDIIIEEVLDGFRRENPYLPLNSYKVSLYDLSFSIKCGDIEYSINRIDLEDVHELSRVIIKNVINPYIRKQVDLIYEKDEINMFNAAVVDLINGVWYKLYHLNSDYIFDYVVHQLQNEDKNHHLLNIMINNRGKYVSGQFYYSNSPVWVGLLEKSGLPDRFQFVDQQVLKDAMSEMATNGIDYGTSIGLR